jgi:hypothetical protein
MGSPRVSNEPECLDDTDARHLRDDYAPGLRN